jgi:hypothetical protein
MIKMVEVSIGSNYSKWAKNLQVYNAKGLESIGKYIAEEIMRPKFEQIAYTGNLARSVAYRVEKMGDNAVMLRVGTLNLGQGRDSRGRFTKSSVGYVNPIEYGGSPATRTTDGRARSRILDWAAAKGIAGAGAAKIANNIMRRGSVGKHLLPVIEQEMTTFMNTKSYSLMQAAINPGVNVPMVPF